MEAFRVAPTAMMERLDPGHYRPVLVENDALLRRFGAHDLGELYLRSGIGHTGAVTLHYTSTEDGVAFVSGGRIVDGHLDMAGAARIQRSAHAGIMSGSRLAPGWVLFVRKGELGNSAIVPPGREVNCSSEVMFLEMRPDADAGFVSSYFNSRHGRMAFLRQQRGMMITSISLYDVPNLPVPKVHRDVARYIGDKIRQAERLRERARKLVESVEQYHRSLIPTFRPSKAKWNTFRIGSQAVEDVIAPHFYPPAVAEYLAGKRNEPLSHLCLSIYSGETYESDDQGVDQATSRSCSGRFLKRPCNRVRTPSRADLDLQTHDLLLTNAAHDKAYIGSDVTYFQGGARNIPSAKVMVLRANRSVVPASYLFAYLNTSVGYLQVQSAIRGISAGIRAQDIGTIRVPLPALSSQDLTLWMSADSKMTDAGASEEAAGALSATATLLVERLIEGRVTESDLIVAQKALEAGDRRADRAILQSLRQSDAPDTKQLISDLDGLYALLDKLDGEND